MVASKNNMYSRDAYELIDYQAEDFRQGQNRPLPPRMNDDVMGADAEWNDKYDEFFAQGEDEDKIKGVVIPRYEGPKNTRCDKIMMSKEDVQTVEISGVPNHAQSSCVYLTQTFRIRELVDNAHSKTIIQRPFSLQRRYSSIVWNCPQASKQFELNPQINCRLAPYLCDDKMLQNCMQVGVDVLTGYQPAPNDAANVVLYKYQTVTVREPLLGFQQGYALLDAMRPMNQGNMKYPLAIQDYALTFKKAPEDWKRVIRDDRLTTSYKPESPGLLVTEPVGSNFHAADAPYRANSTLFLESESAPALVMYSDDSANQSNKNVSTIELHCPVFLPFSAPLIVDPYDDVLQIKNSFYGVADRAALANMEDKERLPYVLETPCKIMCNTSKGLPSFFMIYIEDFGRSYYDPEMTDSLESNLGTDMFIGGHPKIIELQIKVFGQEFPVTKTLDGSELDYLTKKNSHPRCDFYEHMKYDPIVLLRLEDLGLATETMGYPNSKRLELEVEIKQLMMPNNYDKRFYKPDLPAPKITAHAVLIYENHVLEGSNGACDFVWKY